MKASLKLAKITFGDFIRRPEVLIVGALGVIFIASLSMVLLDEELAMQVLKGVEKSQGIAAQKSTLIDGGLVYAEIFTVIVSYLIGMNLIGKDIKSNTIGLFLVKPITRTQYLLGKYIGAVTLSLSLYTAYVVLLMIVLFIDNSGMSFPIHKILMLAVFKIALLYSIILLFAQKVPGFVASLFGTMIYVGGYFSGDFYLFSINAGGIYKFGSIAVYYILPHMVEVSPGSVLESTGGIMTFFKWALVYGVLYSGLWFSGAAALFNRRAI